MAWDERTGKALGNGAAFLRQLRTLKPGQRLGLPLTEFHDMELPVPGSAIYGSTLQEKIDWLCSLSGFTGTGAAATSGHILFETV
jgi:hypothetical protein